MAYEYRFDPSQEFKAAADKYKVLGEERPDGKTLSVTVVKEDSRLNEGIIVLQTGANLGEVVTLIPDEDINQGLFMSRNKPIIVALLFSQEAA